MGNDATVFIVDDDASVLDSLKILLTANGLNVDPYNSARVFLDTYDPDRTGCLLLDMWMPGMDGMELQQELVARQATLPIIVMSGHGDIRMAVKAMKLGAFDFVEKPFRNEDILNAIDSALEAAARQQDQEEYIRTINGRMAQLTGREREIYDYLIEGNPNKVIAMELGISPRTVELHRAHIMEKLQARNLSHLIRMALIADGK